MPPEPQNNAKTPGARAKLMSAASLLKPATSQTPTEMPVGGSASGPVDPRDLELDAALSAGLPEAPRQVEQPINTAPGGVNPFSGGQAQMTGQKVDGLPPSAPVQEVDLARAAGGTGVDSSEPEEDLEGQAQHGGIQPPPPGLIDEKREAADSEIDIDALLLKIQQLETDNAALRAAAPGEAVKVDADIAQLRRQLEEAQAENTAIRDFISNPAEGGLPAPNKPDGNWEGKNVRMLLPWFKVTNPMTVITVAAYAMIYGRAKIGMIPAFGDSMIYNLRNRLADQFLETGAEWAFWLDDDVIVPFGSADLMRQFTGITPQEIPDAVLSVNGLERMISHGKKIVGGVYWGRRKLAPPMFHAGMTDRMAYNAAKSMSGGLVATDWVATGALLVHRDVFLDIRKKYPELAPQGKDQSWNYFLPTIGKGEDVMFCERAKACGHQPYADTGVVCLHVGSQPFGPHNVNYPQMEQAMAGGNINLFAGR